MRTGVSAAIVAMGLGNALVGAVADAALKDRVENATEWWGSLGLTLAFVVAGIVVLAWPDLSLKTLAVLAGIVLLLRGVAFIWGGLQIRRLPEEPGGVAPATA